METEVSVGEIEELVEFTPADLPTIITNQVQKMNALENKMTSVIEKANNAKAAAENANKKLGIFGGRKEAIEELQSSGREIASAVQVSVEAQQLSFEFQKELAEISKFLFGLGVSNIVQNRMVVRQLELQMSGASKEKISELAKQELISVIRQLKAQEDIQNRIEKLTSKIKEHNSELANLAEIYKRHDKELKKQAENDNRHDEELAKQAEIDKLHDEKLARQTEIDKRHDEELARLAEIDKRHDEELAKQKIYLELEGKKISHLTIQIERQKKWTIISMIGLGVCLVALGFYISHFFM